ncbi:hypothetical protein DMI80_11565 [Akkermansia muciniphila]|nr:hypothetical protein CXT89_07205 [Akkermansia muciniphila]QAA37362.1 hypothetical protein C1I88_10965 [Akkermansia muciniphila]QHV66480.1 hypothetical protein DMI78_11550 [Akkermansia muciniphila]QHV68918.1 hypothetical protein DMI79_11610 [Akkermansia muciniphila]QHV71395.1 hypothetical protein DMI80_11565 [Akkermansia muciniphila]
MFLLLCRKILLCRFFPARRFPFASFRKVHAGRGPGGPENRLSRKECLLRKFTRRNPAAAGFRLERAGME